jgi:hypothetical protein
VPKEECRLLRLQPIFDTNIFGDVQSGVIPRRDWDFVVRHRRARDGWPLSQITVLELLAGLGDISPERFPALREQVGLAFAISRGRVLEDPMPLLCCEVLRIAFPPDLVAPAPALLSRYMDVVRRAVSVAQLLKGVPYKGGLQVLESTAAVSDLVGNLKKQWTTLLENFLTVTYPGWREYSKSKGKRLPPELRKQLEPRSAWIQQGRVFVEDTLRDMLKVRPEPAIVKTMTGKWDAALKFTTYVVREFLIGTYSVEKHSSDVFDQFQLRYLAIDRFVIVTADPDLSKRTAGSPQASRILTFEQFLRTL